MVVADLRKESGDRAGQRRATYTTVGADARNRMLRLALARAFGEGEGK